MTIVTTSTTSVGISAVTVTGTSGSLSHSAIRNLELRRLRQNQLRRQHDFRSMHGDPNQSARNQPERAGKSSVVSPKRLELFFPPFS
jgi:hypothetical protein